MMFNQAELQLIKAVFADNEDLLYAIRNVLLQFPLSDAQKKMIKGQVTPEVFTILKKKILPDLDPDAPLSQLADLRVTLTQDLKTKTIDEVAPRLAALETEIAYLEQQLNVLMDIDAPTAEPLRLEDMRTLIGKMPENAYIALNAYLFILGYVDPKLNDLKIIAGIKEETPEEQQKRLKRSSNE